MNKKTEQDEECPPTISEQLKTPFDPKVVHWRVGATNAKSLGCKPWEATSGIGLAYVDARDVMKRFDEVCGDLWQVEYPFEGCCRIGVKIDGEWLWRSNGADTTDVEGVKGQYSDAFKRAAVLWGVGRYLYYLPNKWYDLEKGKIKGSPQLPEWATPEGYGRRFKKGEADDIREQVRKALIAADSVGLQQIRDEYEEPEEVIKFFSLFTRQECNAINNLLSGE
jgi:hypothetical protein